MKPDPAPQFFCFGPRPAHADLPPLERAVLQVLKDARGLYVNMGMTASLIAAMLPTKNAVDESAIRWALRNLLDGGFVEQVPMRDGRWRAKK